MKAFKGTRPPAVDGEEGRKALGLALEVGGWCASGGRGSDEHADPWWTRRPSTAAQGRDRRRRGASASGRYVLGPEGEALEREIAAYVGAAHAVGCNSGTDALHLPLVAGGMAGDEVVVPAFTFFATAEAVSYTGATPVSPT